MEIMITAINSAAKNKTSQIKRTIFDYTTKMNFFPLFFCHINLSTLLLVNYFPHQMVYNHYEDTNLE